MGPADLLRKDGDYRGRRTHRNPRPRDRAEYSFAPGYLVLADANAKRR